MRVEAEGEWSGWGQPLWAALLAVGQHRLSGAAPHKCQPRAMRVLLLVTKHRGFCSQRSSGRRGRSHPPHSVCYFLQSLWLTRFIFL